MTKSLQQKLDLIGKRALITGGSEGIGFACAEALAQAGAEVIIAARSEKKLVAATDVLRKAGHSVEWQVLDVTKPEAVDALAEKLGTVDILVANAGIARSGDPAESVSNEVFLNVMNVNLNGVFWCCRAFGRSMLERGQGSIVTIGSISGHIVNTPQNQANYNASKAAVHQLTKSLAAEWAARGVRVNSIAPGYIETPMTGGALTNDPEMVDKWLSFTPMGRIGQPDEVASLAVFLASDAASYMTGSIVVVDGGYTCW